jgi:hypothetical protein
MSYLEEPVYKSVGVTDGTADGGTISFTNFVDSTTGYTVNGTFVYVYWINAAAVPFFDFSGTLTLTGGKLASLTLNYGMANGVLSGSMSADGVIYDVSTGNVVTPNVVTPTYTPPTCNSWLDQTVLVASTSGSTIFYTEDGSAPSTGSSSVPTNNTITVPYPKNANGYIVDNAIVLRGFAKKGSDLSRIALAAYFFHAN